MRTRHTVNLQCSAVQKIYNTLLPSNWSISAWLDMLLTYSSAVPYSLPYESVWSYCISKLHTDSSSVPPNSRQFYTLISHILTSIKGNCKDTLFPRKAHSSSSVPKTVTEWIYCTLTSICFLKTINVSLMLVTEERLGNHLTTALTWIKTRKPLCGCYVTYLHSLLNF